MELFEFVLVVLVCVFLSTVVDKFVARVSLPVLQVAIGLVAAIVVPTIDEVHVESELFLVLFIAPLLFNETREASVRQLWKSRGDIVSLAIGLVLASVLVVGYTLNLLVPSIPLAAAFALGAALGPTDAAAVSALKSSVNLTDRQRTLLQGESLINDASGVVAFQFSVAAAVTGAFSLAEAAQSFAVLFVGGIAVGIVLGAALAGILYVLGELGFEDVSAHAFYELISPFIVYLLAEAVGVSGILAVVAAGLVMARRRPQFHSTYEARRKLVTDSLWDVVQLLINGTIFVLLGMQLPHVVMPGLTGGLTPMGVVGVIVAVTATSVACRFLWILVLDLLHRRGGDRGWCGQGKSVVRDALVTTIAGARGAVTLSIVLTLPYVLASGEPFPERDLIITIAAGTILLTLVLADTLLPVLAPREDDGDHERELRDAELTVMEATVDELRSLLESPSPDMQDYVPALRLTISSYQVRVSMGRLAREDVTEANQSVEDEEFRLQREELERLHQRHLRKHSEKDWQEHLRALRSIRRSVGYSGRMANVIPGARAVGLVDLMRRYLGLGRHRNADDFTRIYARSCMYAMELEYVSLDYFDAVMAGDDPTRAEAARIRRQSHELALQSVWSRLNYGYDVPLDSTEAYALPYNPATEEFDPHFREQFQKARTYAKDVNENALRIELDEISRLQREGSFDREIANELREDVYLLQMGED